jgi:hypothetical protein
MRKLSLLVLLAGLFLFISNSYAQLSGGSVYPINGTENAPTSFQSLKTAVTYLTANGVTGTGDAVLEFQAGYDPAADTAAGTSITIPNITGTSANLGITFRPGAGFTTKISISLAGAGSIILNGAKYITFDGRQGGSGATGLTLQNGGVNTTAATSTVQFINDAQFCTLRNLSLTNANTNSSSGAGTVYFGTTTGSTGNSNNTITNNVFGPVGGSLVSCSYHIISSGTVGFANASNTITNNEITNFSFRAIVATSGTGNNWTITGNSFYGSLTGTGTHRGVNFLTGSGSGHNISNNFFGGRAANCGGSPYTCAAYIAIDVNLDTLNTSNIQGNTIRNFTNTLTATGTGFIGISISNGKINVGTTAGNVIGSQLDTGSIKLHSTTTGAATIFSFGILVNSGAIGTLDIQNNTAGSISLNPIGVAASNTFIFRGIDNESAVLTGLTNISNNKIGGLVANSIKSTGTGRPVSVQGIASFGSATVTNDSVRNLSSSTTSGSLVGLGAFYGVTGLTYNASNNVVQNLSAFTNTTSITGFQMSLSVANVVAQINVSNNSFTNFSSTGNAAIGGITLSNGSFSGTGINGTISNNTISNFTGTSAGTSSVVFGIQGGTTVTTTLDVTSNTIANLTTATTSTTNTSASAAFGIAWPSTAVGTLNISQNNINSISCTGAAATHVIGIGVFGGGNVFRNRIYGLTNANATTAGTVKGIVARSTGTLTTTNNQISLTGITNDIGVYGIENNSAATRINAYYNSIYIGGTATGTNNTTCIFRNGAAVNSIIDAKDNILCNVRTGGTGIHCAYINNSTTPATGWDSTSGKNNYNMIILPTGATTVGVWNGASLDFAGWKTTTACDINSYLGINTAGTTSGTDVNTSNLFTSPSTGNLNIVTANAEAWYVKGRAVQIASVSNDYNGNSRSTTVAGGAPCIGSHEFTPSSTPPSSLASGAPANSTTTTYSFAGRNLGSLAWGAAGTVPASMDVTYYPGTNAPGGTGFPISSCYWVFTATGGSGFSYDITLNYDESMLGTITDESKIRVAKSDNGGTSYTPYLTPDDGSHSAGMYVLDVANNTILVYGLTSFSVFTLTDADTPLPVELSSFTSAANKNSVELKWTTASEVNNSGFDIERKEVSSSAWKKIGNVAGSGNTNSAHSYSYNDLNLATGKYNYRLKQIDLNGNYKYYNLSNEVIIGVPSKFELSQNYPNPFNPSTKINYELPFDSKVTINLFDMTGREVATVLSSVQSAGYYTVQFNGSALSSGTYFYRINAEGGSQSFTKTLKMTLVK